ncbi:hypothetical protein [Geobacillus sp. TFV-3]|uniref:hypothetical protein n=1 Tax=Geobacillus sp. TFV-3 TaxID=1897059 RepID=UPI001F46912F|nr:hypothetical protein [Geobacillus sp. TFV-3]KAF0996519.1 hypothetical protein BJQ97_03209 [Geobacillus sp. TFV-3]
MAHVFQIKTKPHGFQRYDEFIRDQVIGIGWPLIGKLDGISKDELRERLRNVYHYSGAKLGNALGAIWAFVNTMEQGISCWFVMEHCSASGSSAPIAT